MLLRDIVSTGITFLREFGFYFLSGQYHVMTGSAYRDVHVEPQVVLKPVVQFQN